MPHSLTLRLDGFGADALNRLGKAGEGSPETVLRTAVLYYLADRESGRAAWRLPRFPSRGHERPAVEVVLDDATWGELEEEALRQDAHPEELGVHALLYFLADVDEGRVSARLIDELDE